ncbi:peptidase C39 family protein [Gilvimarinus chinensis]|uniref:peptidase C39 family protein n=1 Tax=Gilvimarinus chinensis TaxID=396005 RepID=UPI003CCB7C2C
MQDSGYGDCSSQNLAVALAKCGYNVHLLQSINPIPFIDSVRSEEKIQLSN